MSKLLYKQALPYSFDTSFYYVSSLCMESSEICGLSPDIVLSCFVEGWWRFQLPSCLSQGLPPSFPAAVYAKEVAAVHTRVPWPVLKGFCKLWEVAAVHRWVPWPVEDSRCPLKVPLPLFKAATVHRRCRCLWRGLSFSCLGFGISFFNFGGMKVLQSMDRDLL
jgi:hypothetical protein